MRSPEMAHDYRYFPDPDLLPVRIDAAWQDRLRAELPERPFDRQRRYMEKLALPYSAASVLVRDRVLGDFLEQAVQLGAKPAAAANWVTNDLQRDLAAAGLTLAQSKVTPAHVAGLVALVEQGVVSSSQAKEVFAEMFQSGETPAVVVDRKGLRQSTDTGQLEGWCDAAIASDPKSADQVRAGNAKAINALKGAVMKLSAGKANPRLVDEILKKRLGA
jgi:aspartyl-tRNA(Asn)/glutamyl-tRNA(Gln) amidotransferase subunit B